MRFTEKIKNFVNEHPLEIAIGVFSVVAFGFGYSVCETVSAKEHMEQLKTATRTGIGIGGMAGMTTVTSFIIDKVPEADKIISEYCDKNPVYFDKLFQENPMIIDATKRLGEISLPLPKITY